MDTACTARDLEGTIQSTEKEQEKTLLQSIVVVIRLKWMLKITKMLVMIALI